jgi:hypothetical protein
MALFGLGRTGIALLNHNACPYLLPKARSPRIDSGWAIRAMHSRPSGSEFLNRQGLILPSQSLS